MFLFLLLLWSLLLSCCHSTDGFSYKESLCFLLALHASNLLLFFLSKVKSPPSGLCRHVFENPRVACATFCSLYFFIIFLIVVFGNKFQWLISYNNSLFLIVLFNCLMAQQCVHCGTWYLFPPANTGTASCIFFLSSFPFSTRPLVLRSLSRASFSSVSVQQYIA